MGFTSYLEDIISKSEDYKHFLDEYNSYQKDSEKINVHRVFDFIRECKALLNRIKKTNIEDFDKILKNYLLLDSENKELKKENFKYKSSFENSDKKINNLEQEIRNLKSEIASYEEKNEDIRKLQENEHTNRKEFESMIDNRYRNIYQNEIKIVEKELSDFRFTVSECLDEISNIIGQQSLNNEQNSRMKTLIKNLKSQCNQNYQ